MYANKSPLFLPSTFYAGRLHHLLIIVVIVVVVH